MPKPQHIEDDPAARAYLEDLIAGMVDKIREGSTPIAEAARFKSVGFARTTLRGPGGVKVPARMLVVASDWEIDSDPPAADSAR